MDFVVNEDDLIKNHYFQFPMLIWGKWDFDFEESSKNYFQHQYIIMLAIYESQSLVINALLLVRLKSPKLTYKVGYLGIGEYIL